MKIWRKQAGKGKSRQQITISKDTGPTGNGAGNAREAGHKLPTQQELFERLRQVPSGEEPAFWPVRVMSELEYITSGEVPDHPLEKQWAPMRESLKKVKRAYEVIAYPHVKYEGWRECIQAELGREREWQGRDQVELNDAELRIVGKLAATAKIPFDPQRRVYSYGEVLKDFVPY